MHAEAIETASVNGMPRGGFQGALHVTWPVLRTFADGTDDLASTHPNTSTADNVRGRRCSTRMRRVLIIDDEQLIANTVVRILNLNGFEALAAYSGDAALGLVDTFCPDIVITDVRMPGRSGIEVGNLIRERCPDTLVVLFSGQAGASHLVEAARSGQGFELWSKPLPPPELLRRLRALSSEC